MAKQSAGRVSSGGMATVLMIVAVVASVGLLVWLSYASQPAEGPAMAMDDPGLDVTASRAVTAAEFGADIASRVGQDVVLAGVMVSNVVSDQLIQVDVPSADGTTPFTIHLLPGAAATAPAAQTTIEVDGRVLAQTDSVLNAWEQAGTIPSANVRTTLQAGSYFIEARMIRPGSGGE